jgi:hypothetical protein
MEPPIALAALRKGISEHRARLVDPRVDGLLFHNQIREEADHSPRIRFVGACQFSV